MAADLVSGQQRLEEAALMAVEALAQIAGVRIKASVAILQRCGF